MPQYTIEDNIDFYSELMKDDDNDNDQHTNANICLLTQQPLDNTALTLPCNHSFNYTALFNEVKIQKKDPYSKNNYDTNKAYSHGMNCPYCRTKYNFILPQCYKIPHVKNNVEFVNKRTNCNLPFDIYCKYKNNVEFCDDVFMTNIGKYCKQHYQIIIKEQKKKEKEELKKIINEGNTDVKLVDNKSKHMFKNVKTIELFEPINHNIIAILKGLSVIYLKRLNKHHNLKVSGTKEILINRLHNYYYYNFSTIEDILSIVNGNTN